jgi:hypothetical protein
VDWLVLREGPPRVRAHLLHPNQHRVTGHASYRRQRRPPPRTAHRRAHAVQRSGRGIPLQPLAPTPDTTDNSGSGLAMGIAKRLRDGWVEGVITDRSERSSPARGLPS